MSYSMSDSENVATGIGAALFESLLLQPTLYWKNARAQGLPFTISPSLVYRGTSTSIVNEMQMMGVQFGLTGALQRLYISVFLGAYAGQRVNLTFRDEVLLATAGGMISAFISSPTELVMIQQQHNGGSIFTQLGSVVRRYGYFSNGICRALSQCIIRDGLYTAGLLGVTPALQTVLVQQHGHSEQMAGLYASVIGGVGCAVLSQPLDVVKTCMQGDLEQKGPFGQGGAMGAWRGLLADGGVSRLYRGCMWRSINVVATVYIANEVRTRASGHFENNKTKRQQESERWAS